MSAQAARVKLSVGAELPGDLAAALLNLATVWMRQAARFEPQAVETISRASAAASGAEVAFLCRVDPENGRIGDVEVQAVGNNLGVCRPPALVGPDTLLLHTHVRGTLPFPSEQDRQALATVPLAVGHGICTPDGLALHIVREPSASRADEDGRPQPMAIQNRGLEGGVLLCDGRFLLYDRQAQAWRAVLTPRGSAIASARIILKAAKRAWTALRGPANSSHLLGRGPDALPPQ